jgi:hypothetical protein
MPRERSDPGSGSGPPRYPGTFLLAFREAIAGLGWEIRRWLGDAVVCADAEGEEHTVGLENLYRRARREDRSRWPELIRDFLVKVRTAEVAADAEADLNEVADQLLVRLGQPFTAIPQSMRIWAQQLEGTPLSINLVIDHLETMSYVTEEMVANSGRSGDEWLECALANLRKRTPEGCFASIHEDSGMLLCSVADAYDSSRALLLDTLLPETNEFGCLVAIPSRDELLLLPLTRQAIPYLHLMKVLAEKNFKVAPYAISDEVFWVHRGVWRAFSIEVRNQELVIRPPPEFIEVLDELAPDEDEETAPEEEEGESGSAE